MTRGNDNIIQGDGHVLDALSVYIDGALEAHEQEQVRAHITQCGDCRAEYLEMRATKQMLTALPTVAPPRAFTLTQEMVAPRTSFWQRLFAPRYAPRFATASALAFALLVLILVSDLGLTRQYSANMALSPASMSEEQRLVDRESTAASTPQYGEVMMQPAATMEATSAAVAANIPSPEAGGSDNAAKQANQAATPTEVTAAMVAPPTDPIAERDANMSAQQTADTFSNLPMQGGSQASGESHPVVVPRTEGNEADSFFCFDCNYTDTGKIVLTMLEVTLALVAVGLMVGALLARRSRA